ncbi:beta-1,4-galactosyltransferase 4-like [Penaeus japonicus]|uniref:beta-1,4-galactosyltransferase 4-like n=1 Tax=Penaeus japonicus TaxID=27405 RepID=UPI001C70CBCB|nr:beta-1,4-galactosyltransferase 4-like [Penaeus japonicus]
MTEAEAEGNATNVLPGGSWWPPDCESTWRLAVIVPYRNREVMVGPFLNHMHPFLQRQLLNYTIFFVEQSGEREFNRAKLMNIGYVLAQRSGPWDCYAFQDIDCIPEDDRNLYYCADQPHCPTIRIWATAITNIYIVIHPLIYANVTSTSAAIATCGYDKDKPDLWSRYFTWQACLCQQGLNRESVVLPYETFYGCACLMTSWQVEKVNGWSNKYFGWGGEDDNMWRRIEAEHMRVANESARRG